jgi:hypothetical protein
MAMSHPNDQEYPGLGGFRARRAQRRRDQFGGGLDHLYGPPAADEWTYESGEQESDEDELSWLPSLSGIKSALSSWNPFGSAPAPSAPSPSTPSPTAPAPSTAPPAPAVTSAYLKDQPSLVSAPLTPPKPIILDGAWPSGRKALAETYNRLGGLMQAVAAQLGVEVQSVLAVWKVESGGKVHVPNQAIIRFENHLLYKLWGKDAEATYDQYFRHGGRGGQGGNSWENHQYRESTTESFRTLHTGQQADEYRALQLATRLASQATAVQCASIGGPQILCSNYRLLGYASPVDMYNAFQAGERAHVLGFFDFCKNQSAPQPGGLVTYMQQRNWAEVARYYNGSGQVSTYGAWIAEAYADAMRLPIVVVLREMEYEWAWEGDGAVDAGGDAGPPPVEGAGGPDAGAPSADASTTTADGYPVTISSSVVQDILSRLERLSARKPMPKSTRQDPASAVKRKLKQVAGKARKVGSVREGRTGRRYPVFQGQTQQRTYNMVARRRSNGQHEIVLVTPSAW